jgi:hypothetical protein
MKKTQKTKMTKKEQPDHPMEPCENIDSDILPKTMKRLAWLEATLQEAERLKAPDGTSRKSKSLKDSQVMQCI